MPTDAQNAVVSALMQSVVVSLPLWIAVLRYIAKIGITEEDIDASDGRDIHKYKLEIYNRFQKRRGMAIGFILSVLLLIVLAGVLTIVYLQQVGTIQIVGSGSIDLITSKQSLGYALLVMLVIMPVQFTCLIIYAAYLQSKADTFRKSVKTHKNQR
ncbi:hypothetical protein [Halopenitus persicus]|uniref:Uncharacterized protein n=1 Tax=Halopenitus persicus TaxID=1048396 RepID=A0A1H3JTR2_9EURY|nr:hypothetical protein [Halopenitus persicus]SDY42758.1 hypothetical protein SAMN05216564_105124 [Halopenitus persicus]